MIMRKATRLTIRGRVQAVGYRAWLVREASRRALAGWVRNKRGDSTVEALVLAESARLVDLIAACRQGPPAAQVTGIDVEDIEIGADEAADLAGIFAVRPTD